MKEPGEQELVIFRFVIIVSVSSTYTDSIAGVKTRMRLLMFKLQQLSLCLLLLRMKDKRVLEMFRGRRYMATFLNRLRICLSYMGMSLSILLPTCPPDVSYRLQASTPCVAPKKVLLHCYALCSKQAMTPGVKPHLISRLLTIGLITVLGKPSAVLTGLPR
jgi:hypothetical protein